MDQSATYSIDDALAWGLADEMCAEHGLVLNLYGPERGLWLADFSRPGAWDGHLIEGYVRAPTRAQAIREAAERVMEVLSE